MVLVLTFVVLESADLPEVRVHGLLAVGKVLLREEVDLVLGDLRQVILTRCDHRASGKNPPRTIYGAIVAEADRQIIPETVIARTMAYSAKLYPDGDFETLYARSREHLLEKYAEGGYMRLWLNSERNVRSLESLRAIIRNEPLLRSLCEEWYKANR